MDAGSHITWKGVVGEKKVIHRGTILKIEPAKIPQITDLEMELGLEDIPENYTRITHELTFDGKFTRLEITEDHFNGDERGEGMRKNSGKRCYPD